MSRLLAIRVLAALVGLTALLQILDLLDNSQTLFQAGEGVTGMAVFALWRLASIAEQVLPIAVLAGTLATFFGLVRSNEMVAMRGAGVTIFRIIGSTLPVALAAAALHFALIDRITPWTEAGFAEWWDTVETRADERAGKPGGDSETIWMRADNTIVSVGSVESGRSRMSDLTFITLDERGVVRQRLEAQEAERAGAQWRLREVRQITVTAGSLTVTQSETAPWPVQLRPEEVAGAHAPSASLSISRLSGILRGDLPSLDSRAHYRTMLHENLAAPLSALLMVLLAVPAAFGNARHGGAKRGLLVGFVLGMGYLVVNGVLIAMGEVGTLPPALAVWTAPAIFACGGGALMLKLEEP